MFPPQRTSKWLGLSLVEILVAIAIIAVLLALLLPAVQKVRTTASLIREKNKVKQIELAIHMWDENRTRKIVDLLFWDILPYLEHPLTEEQLQKFSSTYPIPVYMNYDDPSITDRSLGAISYAYNRQIYQTHILGSRQQVLKDGSSNTIEITTHYSMGSKKGPDNIVYIYQRELLSLLLVAPFPLSNPSNPNLRNVLLPPTFADAAMGDVLPGSPEAQTLTFQLRPPVDNIDPRIPQSPYTTGLLVGLADGSVRMLNPNISPRTFWAAVTPNGGEVLGPDW
jgi:type II secretory pathway pseudopilin PulG